MHRSILFLAAAAARAFSQSLTSALDDRSDLSMFAQYVEQAGLLDTITSLDNVTIFAPTNEAFESALDAFPQLVAANGSLAGNSSDDDSDGSGQDGVSERFANILRYHVVPDVGLFPSNINEYPGSFYPTAYEGIVVNPYQDGEGVKVFSAEKRISEVVAGSIEFDNGVVHTLDSILLPPEGPATTALDMGFKYFYGALQQLDLIADLNTSSSLTVFIPTDQAFIDVGSALQDLSTDALQSTLLFHVVAGDTMYTTNLTDGTELDTLADVVWDDGLDVTVNNDDGALYVSNARVVTPNILLRNGVAHLVDQVLNVREDDEDYGYEYDVGDGDGYGVPGFEDAASATIPALTSGIPSVTSTFSPTATFSQVSGSDRCGVPSQVTLLGMLYAALMALA